MVYIINVGYMCIFRCGHGALIWFSRWLNVRTATALLSHEFDLLCDGPPKQKIHGFEFKDEFEKQDLISKSVVAYLGARGLSDEEICDEHSITFPGFD